MATIEEIQPKEETVEEQGLKIETDLSKPETAPEQVETIVDAFLPRKTYEVSSRNYFHVNLPFESESGYQVSAFNTLMDGTQYLVQTSTTNGNTASVKKGWNGQAMLSFRERSRIIVGCAILQTANQTGYFITGTTTEGYGFKIVGNIIYGVSAKSGEATTKLGTFTGSQGLTLEARFVPSQGVTYYLNGEEKGTTTTNLPSSASYNQLMTTQITTNTTSQRDYRLSFFDYMQERTTT